MTYSVKIDSRTLGVTEFTKGSATVDKRLRVLIDFALHGAVLVHATITVSHLSLEKDTLDKGILFTIRFFVENLNGFNLFRDQFHQ